VLDYKKTSVLMLLQDHSSEARKGGGGANEPEFKRSHKKKDLGTTRSRGPVSGNVRGGIYVPQHGGRADLRNLLQLYPGRECGMETYCPKKAAVGCWKEEPCTIKHIKV